MIKGKEATELLDSLGIKRMDCGLCRAKFRPNQEGKIKEGRLYCPQHSDGTSIEIPNRR